MGMDDITKTITIKRGDSFKYNINIKDQNDTPVDMTGFKMYFTVRKSIPSSSTTSDTDSLISKEFDGNNTGVYEMSLSREETNLLPVGDFFYDIQITNSELENHSSYIYKFIVESDISRII